MPLDPWDLADALVDPEPRLIDAAIAYLEADPWAFRTGYAKGRLMRRLRGVDLDERQRTRLRPVLVRYATVGARFELVEACKLARRHRVPGLRDDLVRVLHASDRRAALRALRLLFAMREPRLSERELARGRELVRWLLRDGVERDRRWDSLWIRPAALRLWPPPERAALERVANGAPSTERAVARRVLRHLQPDWRPGPKHGSSAVL